MTETRQSYDAGEIDAILRKADDNPPVHPYLIEHLREKFPRSILRDFPMGMTYGEAAINHNSQQAGAEAVIDYLETLVNRDQEDLQKKEPVYELSRSEAEGTGTDPRRPRPRDRG